ncbi:MAG: MarR family winged helix-turn-helix transcriptional regulator [Deltaproteobacteria bacterium]|jgi:DNA-binding MarR family transcriptional regulator|nr:MarR family winged helix-turn-helix transcriptional regulator [Deltaproteobacteria bacterium]
MSSKVSAKGAKPTSKAANPPVNCLCLKTRRLTASLTRFYDRTLAAAGLSVCQYGIALIISRVGPCSVRRIAEVAELDRSTLARNLKPLLTKGLVEDSREVGHRDRRLTLSKEGQKRLTEAGLLWDKAQKAVQNRLGEAGLAALDHLAQLVQSLDNSPK